MTKPNLTAEVLREALRYEPETGDFYWNARRNGVKSTDVRAGFIHHTGHRYITFNGRQYCAHRLAWMYVYGSFPSDDIDHINGIPADNRIVNLRDVNHSVNMQNQRRAQKNNSSKLLGVSKHGNKFQSAIRINYVPKHLGTFDTPELAHAAYIEAKRKHHVGCTI